MEFIPPCVCEGLRKVRERVKCTVWRGGMRQVPAKSCPFGIYPEGSMSKFLEKGNLIVNLLCGSLTNYNFSAVERLDCCRTEPNCHLSWPIFRYLDCHFSLTSGCDLTSPRL